MKKLTLMSVLAVLCLQMKAQQPPDIKPLTIGDTLPDITLRNFINYKDTAAKLSDFRGKFIILDFWAAWCGACITALPKLDSLQVKYEGWLNIILVNCTRRSHDTEKSIKNLATNNWQNAYHKNLNCLVVADTTDMFRHLFTFKVIPHYVWIDPNRVILAITSSDEISETNIVRMLKEGVISLPVKNDTNPNNSN